MTDTEKIQQVINNLISGETLNSFYENRIPEFNINGFSGIALNDDQNLNFNNSKDREKKNYSDRTQLIWEQLLLRLKERNKIKNNEKYGIREVNFPEDEESLVKFINENIDLDDQNDNDFSLFFEKYIENYLKNREQNAHWNESVAKLAQYYYDFFKKNDSEEGLKNTNYTVSDLLNADVANSFKKNEEWVKPWETLKKLLQSSENELIDNYKTVRNTDRIERVLTDNTSLQYTCDKKIDEDNYLRLIMPEYSRIVEIEDLNRNFWVIGQTLSAICAFLFDKDNSIPRILEALLDEIVQMWEEIFKLWLKTQIFSQKDQISDYQILFLPIASKQDKTLKLFDNFINENINLVLKEENTIIEKNREILEYLWEEYFNYLKNKYDKSILLIIPEIRDINYGENYYARAFYPGTIFYDKAENDIEKRLYYVPFNKLIIADAKHQAIDLIE